MIRQQDIALTLSKMAASYINASQFEDDFPYGNIDVSIIVDFLTIIARSSEASHVIRKERAAFMLASLETAEDCLIRMVKNLDADKRAEAITSGEEALREFKKSMITLSGRQQRIGDRLASLHDTFKEAIEFIREQPDLTISEEGQNTFNNMLAFTEQVQKLAMQLLALEKQGYKGKWER